MIEIIHVDEGEVLLRFCQTMAKPELIELLEHRLKFPISLMIFYTIEGKVIDLDSIPKLQDTHELYLFRRDRVVDHCTIAPTNWSDYKDFQDIDIYELSSQFDSYEKFPQGYEKVSRIEKCLYELYCQSKRLYSKFMVKYEYIEKCKTFIEVRIKASKVLLNNLKLYYKEIKVQWKSLYSSASELHIQYSGLYKVFEKHFQAFVGSGVEDQFSLFIKQSNLNGFTKKLMKKLNKCIHQIHEVRNLVLGKIKQGFVASFRDIDRVQAFYQYSSKMYSEFDIHKQQKGFANLLLVCDLYSSCRQNIDSIINNSSKDKKLLLNEILNLEKAMNKYKELSLQQGMVLNDIDPIENAIQECVIRVEELYKDKVIILASLAAQKLKYKVKVKLDKFSLKLSKFRDFQEFLKIPTHASEAKSCYEQIKLKHCKSKSNIEKTFEKIAFLLISNTQSTQQFLDSAGKILPSRFYKTFEEPLLDSALITKILSIDKDPEDCEIERVTCEKQEIIEYYEAEIKNAEKQIQRSIEEYRVKERKINLDISKTVLDVKEIETVFLNNQKTLKNVSQELEIVKVIGQENLKHKLMEELQKLKEKEEAFKMIFMEKHRELSDLNSKLKFSAGNKGEI